MGFSRIACGLEVVRIWGVLVGAGHFVGRVGGLAVALGVGAAVSLGQAVAWADETSGGGAVSAGPDATGTTSGAERGSDSASPDSPSDTDPSSGETGSAGAEPKSSDDESGDDPVDAPDEVSSAGGSSTDSGTADNSSDSDPVDTTDDLATPGEGESSHDSDERQPVPVVARMTATPSDTTTEDADPVAEVSADPSPTEEPDLTARPVVVSSAVSTPQATLPATINSADPVAAQPDANAEPAAATEELAAAVAASLLGTTAPGDIPVDTPAEWVLLAAARRELADPDESRTTNVESVVPQSLLTTAAPDPLGAILTGAFQTITGVVSTAVSVVGGAITGALDLLGGTIDLAATATGVLLDTAVNVLNWGITTTANLITGALTTAVTALADAFTSTPTPLGNAIADTLTFLNDVVTSTVNILSQATTGVLSSTATGLTTAITLLSDTVVGALNLATQAIDAVVQTITAIIDPTAAGTPVAADDSVTVAEDTALVLAAAALLANDTDPDNDPLSITAAGQGAHGTTELGADGTITYTPLADFNGTDTFTYTVSDGTHTDTATVTVAVTAVNDDPANGSSQPGAPNSVTGSVVGTVSATDADGDTLTYSAPIMSAKDGAIVLVGNTFTYTPTAAARQAAGAADATAADKQDTFTVTADDGHGGTLPINVTVGIAPPATTTTAGLSVISTITIDGWGLAAIGNADDTRVVVTTDTGAGTTLVHVVDPETGTVVGTPATVPGGYGYAWFGGDGTRALITTSNSVGTQNNTSVAVIDTTTGAQAGTTVGLAGDLDYSGESVLFTADGRVVVVTVGTDDQGHTFKQVAIFDLAGGTQLGDIHTFGDADVPEDISVQLDPSETRILVASEVTGDNATRVIVLDAEAGTEVGNPREFTGESRHVLLSADGTRVLVSAVSQGAGTSDYQTAVTVLDLSTGAQVGTTYLQSGYGAAQLNADGSRAIVTITDVTARAYTITTIDTSTGAVVGSTGALSGASLLPPLFTADLHRGVITGYTLDADSGGITAVQVAVIDTATGALVGGVVTVPGSPLSGGPTGPSSIPVDVQLTSDGTRAVVTTVAGSVTRVAVVNTLNGTQVGSTVSVAGSFELGDRRQLPVLGEDGKRAVAVTVEGDESGGYTTHFAVIDLEHGVKLGATVTLAGGLWDTPPVVFGQDGSRAVLWAFTDDGTSGSRYAIVDTVTGAQLGSTHAGGGYTEVWFSDDGTRVVAFDYPLGNGFAISVWNAATGALISSTSKFAAVPQWSNLVNDPATRSLILASDETVSQLELLNLTTGTPIGSPVSLTGGAYDTWLAENLARAVAMTVSGDDTVGHTTTVTILRVTENGVAPANGQATVGDPDASTGVVAGTVTATDADADPLTYSAPATTAKGTVSIDATTGAFVFTPTAEARHVALATGATTADKTDTFTVSVGDGNGNVLPVIVTVAIQPGTNAQPQPAPGTPEVGAPDAVTGVVLGSVTATDADNDTLTYSGPTSTAKGTLSVDATSGAFVYKPTVAARQAAAAANAGTADKQDTFAVTVNDGHGATTQIGVTVTIAPASTDTPTVVTAVGGATAAGQVVGVYVNQVGTRAVVVTVNSASNATTYTVINTATGAKVGNAVTLNGNDINGSVTADGGVMTSPVFNAAGTRAVVQTTRYNPATSDAETRVAVIDTASGAQLGSTLIIAGSSGAMLSLNATGTRVVVVTVPSSSIEPGATTRVYLLDTGTGGQVVAPRTLDGAGVSRFSSDGSRLVVSALSYASETPTGYNDIASRITVIDTTTGAQIGSTITRTGGALATPNADGSRLILTNVTGDYTSFSSTVSVLNTATGAHLGTDVTLSGVAIQAPALFTGNGARAVVTGVNLTVVQTKLAVVDVAVGGQIGSTITIPGHLGDTAAVVGDGVNRLIVISRDGSGMSTVTVINTGAGAVVGTPQTFAAYSTSGEGAGIQFDDDGTRALVATRYYSGSSFTDNTRIMVLDTATGGVLGSVVTVGRYGWAEFTADGTRVVVVSPAADAGNMTILDAATGAEVADADLPGGAVAPAQLSFDGTLGVITTTSGDSTKVVVVDTATGAQIGQTFTVTGLTNTAARVSRDGASVVLATSTGNGGAGYTTKVSTLAIT